MVGWEKPLLSCKRGGGKAVRNGTLVKIPDGWKAIEDLKKAVGIKPTIKDYGIEEKDFLATLDEMVENAFDDQCTGANPRYPLMRELKEMYINAYDVKAEAQAEAAATSKKANKKK